MLVGDRVSKFLNSVSNVTLQSLINANPQPGIVVPLLNTDCTFQFQVDNPDKYQARNGINARDAPAP